ncbi:MAG: response regulator [Bacteroidetes bacterium]|jgi:CheY-like chemotaxis protein|nr:response regulator [Bacteroidota bacterium]
MKKILVIEDTLNIRENIAEFLELKSYDVLTASDGTAALELIKANHLDLVICDVKMPKMDGFELKRLLNGEANLEAIPFIFLTAAAQKGDIEEGQALGAAAYLTKPFEMEELMQWVDHLLKG